MPASRLGQARGRETILECRITAYPHAVNYWQKDGRRIISSSKHRIEAYDDGENKLTLSLRIVNIDADDYGRYDCIAANALGTDQQTIHLFGSNICFCLRFNRCYDTSTAEIVTRNSSGDEIANVNFLYDDIAHVLQNTIDSCINCTIDRRGLCWNACLPNSVK